MIQNGIHCNGSFSGLSVSDNEFSLSSTNWEHGVNRQNTGLQRNIDRFSVNDSRSRLLNRTVISGNNFSLTVNRISQSIHYSAKEGIPYRNPRHFIGTNGTTAFHDSLFISKEDDTDTISFYILHHAADTVVKYDNLSVHGMVQPVDDHNTVSYGTDKADFLLFRLQVKVLYRALQDTHDILTASTKALTHYFIKKLLSSALGTPVVLVIAHLKNKAST